LDKFLERIVTHSMIMGSVFGNQKAPKGVKTPWRLNYWHLLEIPFHGSIEIDC
jgi:hypothetical protein